MEPNEIMLDPAHKLNPYKPATVFILKDEFGYDDGDVVRGVFTTEELALAAYNDIPAEDRNYLHCYEIALNEYYKARF
jgi:hypothetical protein